MTIILAMGISLNIYLNVQLSYNYSYLIIIDEQLSKHIQQNN